MRIVVNDILPFKGYVAMTVWPFIFIRKAVKDNVIWHEVIHGEQQKEMLLLFFHLWYVVEWLVRLCLYGNQKEAYRNISFEQEAYLHENDVDYKREHYAWAKYLTQKTYRR